MAVLSASFILFLCSCSAGKEQAPDELTFHIGDSSITVSAQKISAAADFVSLLLNADSFNGAARMQPAIIFELPGAVDSVEVYDYYDDMETLLFENILENTQNRQYTYIVPHSSASPNNPYGYNEFEYRGFIFVITTANARYAYPFKVSLDGSHI